MPQDIVRLKGMAGKTVEEVTVTNESDFRHVSVRFTDHTALHFGFSMALSIDPELVGWRTGDGRRIRKFPVIFERSWME
jgi:hypothetical protein